MTIKCTKCKGKLIDQNKTISTIDHKEHYKQKSADVYKCEDCGHKIYVR